MNPETDPEAVTPIPATLDYNITDKELNRDSINLHLSEPDSYVAANEELRALYPPGEYDRMMADFKDM